MSRELIRLVSFWYATCDVVRQGNFIRQRHLRNSTDSAINSGYHCWQSWTNGNIVRNRVRDRGISCRRPYHGPIFRHHRLNRQQLARNNRGRNWRNVVFSDESCINISNADDRTRIYRRRNERYADNCVFTGL